MSRWYVGGFKTLIMHHRALFTYHGLFLSLSLFLIKGSHLEVVYNLQTFGIMAQALPFSGNGEVLTTDFHVQKWQQRRKQEQLDKKSKSIGTPINNDVLFGRGKFVQDNLGNLRFRQIIDENRERYDKLDKDGKTRLAEEIVRRLKGLGARFLKDEDGGGWVEADEKLARKKVSMCFRSQRKLAKIPKQSQIKQAMMLNFEDDTTGSEVGG
jgi:hypothetical protein